MKNTEKQCKSRRGRLCRLGAPAAQEIGTSAQAVYSILLLDILCILLHAFFCAFLVSPHAQNLNKKVPRNAQEIEIVHPTLQ